MIFLSLVVFPRKSREREIEERERKIESEINGKALRKKRGNGDDVGGIYKVGPTQSFDGIFEFILNVVRAILTSLSIFLLFLLIQKRNSALEISSVNLIYS